MLHILKRFGLIALAYAYALILILSAGCKSSQWAAKKIAKIEVKAPQALPEYCGKRFPPLVYDSTRIEYRQGATIVKTDTIVSFDTVTNTLTRTIYREVFKTDTIYQDRIKQVENKAQIELLTQQREELLLEAQKEKQGKKVWVYVAIGLIAYTVIRIVLRLWLKINLP